jgi:alpha-beta hydrolase superfamily lysophospholipase
LDSSFDDWIGTTRAVCDQYLSSGRHVALFGQSMGACAAIAVASAVTTISGLVAWSPGANIDPFMPTSEGVVEEDGQLVRDAYWHETHAAHIADRFGQVTCPAYVVFGTADHLVDERNRQAIVQRAQANHHIDVIEGLAHSAWSYENTRSIVETSVNFLADALR